MANKIVETAEAIRARLAGRRADVATARAEIAELERQAAWAEGQERRDRLAALRSGAENEINNPAELAAISEATRKLAAATAHLRKLCSARRDRISALSRLLRAEGVRSHPGAGLPPSPVDAGMGLLGDGVVVGHHRVRIIDAAPLISRATAATGLSDDDLIKPIAAAETEMPNPLDEPGRYFRHLGHGGVFRFADAPPAGQDSQFVEITPAEWLAHQWDLDVDALPADVRAAIPAVTA